MRVKSDERRQAIMEVACALFREIGFERTSMAAISARVGGSKATLYSYFKSKEELFTAVMMEAMGEQGERMIELLAEPDHDLRTTLLTFSNAYLDLVLSDDAVAMLRTGMMDSNHDKLGRLLYASGPEYGWNRVALQLRQWSDEGRLRIADAKLAALQLKGLLEAGLLEPKLYGAAYSVDREKSIHLAVDMFLQFYQSDHAG